MHFHLFEGLTLQAPLSAVTPTADNYLNIYLVTSRGRANRGTKARAAHPTRSGGAGVIDHRRRFPSHRRGFLFLLSFSAARCLCSAAAWLASCIHSFIRLRLVVLSYICLPPYYKFVFVLCISFTRRRHYWFVSYAARPFIVRLNHRASMGFFDHLQKGGAFSLQPKKPQIRKVVQTRAAAPSRPPSQTPGHSASRTPPAQLKARESASRSVSRDRDPPSSKRRLGTPAQSRKRQTPELRLSSDDDASDTDTSFEVRKRARTGDSAEPDPARRMRSMKAFSEDGIRNLPMIQAAEITSIEKAGNFKPAFGAAKPLPELLLQYPSASTKER